MRTSDNSNAEPPLIDRAAAAEIPTADAIREWAAQKRAFISSVMAELPAERAAAAIAIRAIGARPVMFEQFGGRDADPEQAYLSEVQRPFDHVFCNGDIVDYGPSPNECITWLRDHHAEIVRGNHDHAVGAHTECGCVPPYLRLSRATREVTWKLLDANEQKWLAALPMTKSQTIQGATFYQCHAAPGMISRYLPPETAEEDWERLFENVAADFILLGHTHMQMDKIIANHRFVNPGSVGQPKPRGQMAQYAVWKDGEVHLKSVSYDYHKTQSKIRALPVESDVIEQLCWILEHGALQGSR